VYSGEREARQILNSIQSGADTFENAARNMSRDVYADNSGDMGNRMIFELSAEIPSAQLDGLLALPWGSLSDVIRLSNDSYAIFRVEETARQADIQDYTIMDKIRNYMMTYQRGRIEDWLVSEAEVFIEYAKDVGFDSAAQDMGIYKYSFGPLPLNYGSTSLFSSVATTGIYVLYDEYNRVNAGTNDRFWQAAFTTPIHTPSVPIIIGTNVVVLYPNEESEADEYNTSLIQMYYSYWLSNAADTDIHYFFLNNPKLDDKFWDIFQYFLE
ncbi:MAG: peptidyl-prolyl cis-trans isomerase, partial [Treponema sp.]|nr:peptidyl-prolyl cis-trans isomerase [Treponema sp.]